MQVYEIKKQADDNESWPDVKSHKFATIPSTPTARTLDAQSHIKMKAGEPVIPFYPLGVAIGAAPLDETFGGGTIKTNPDLKLGVAGLDLDRFKLVNDTLGHTMGDRLLKAVANRLQSCLRKGDTLSRFGGDEFTLLLPEVRTRDDVVVIAEKILDRLNEAFVIDGHELFVGASIGIAMYPEAGDSGEALIQNADIAIYHVKALGKNGYQFLFEEMNHQSSSRLNLERELRNGLIQGEFEVFYQPQVCLENGSITGVEALVRWRHGLRGMIDPGEFLPLAEETGLVLQIDEFVQQQAFHDVAAWHRAGLGDISLSVNLTAQQMEQESFVERFLGALNASGLAPQCVKLEITENTLMQDMEVIIPKLKAIRQVGVCIAIDDFGTGYSSLSYLHQFPINTMKIDRTFVGDIRSGCRRRGKPHAA